MTLLCDFCGYCEYKGIVVWGREPNEAEKKFNDNLEAEHKDYWCDLHERYFTKSFPKRKYHCKPGEEEAAEYEAEHEGEEVTSLCVDSTKAVIDPTAYGCKFDRSCPGFNSDKYRCTHGGGRLCHLWRKLLDYEMYATDKRPVRSKV